MKALFLIGALIFGQLAFATEAPANYPLVKGIVRKIDFNSGRISLKHEDIPNLEMPGMTMSFVVQEIEQLKGLQVGDQVVFAADEIDGETTVLWIQKAHQPAELTSAHIFCTGVAPTTPRTKVEIEIRPERFSTIRYEHIEGALPGTAHINSIGYMRLEQQGDTFRYSSDSGVNGTVLIFKKNGNQIRDYYFSLFSAGMNKTPVQCAFR